MKWFFYSAGGVVASIILTAGVLVLTFDVERQRTRIEAAASETTGMTVRILGGMKLTLIPRVALSLEDLFISNRGMMVASARLSVARVRLLPLFRGEVRMREIVILGPKVFVTREKTGRFNFEGPGEVSPGKESSAMLLDVRRIFVTKGYFLYRDEDTNRKIEANGCTGTIRNLLAGGAGPAASASFEGDVSCPEAGTEELRVSDVRAVVKAGRGGIEANPLTMKIFGGNGRGSVRRVIKGERAEYRVDFAVSKLRFEEVLGMFHRKKNVIGELELESRLTMRGGSAEEMTRSAQGTVCIRGRNLLLENLDLDLLLERAERSQHFNLVDVAAFLLVGPLGTLLTKGYDFGTIYQEIPGARSEIRMIVSDWSIKDGVGEAEDAAFTTVRNRFAVRGKLDFVHQRFEDLSVAVLNEKGCAVSSQRIRGEFRNPQIDPPLPRRTLLGPIVSLLRAPFELLKGDECEIFYRGSVAQP
jgi:hypothetical protein